MVLYVGLFYVIADGLITMFTSMLTIGMCLCKELLLVLLILAIVEAIRSFLHFIIQLTIITISILLGVVVYVSAFFVGACRIMLEEPLEQAVIWQQKTMIWMKCYLPIE